MVLARAIQALVKRGDTNRALQIVQSVDQEYSKNLLGDIASTLIEAGQIDRGLELADSIDKSSQAWAIVTVVNALVSQGEINQARQLIESTPNYPTLGLAMLAVQLANIGATEQAVAITASIDNYYQNWILPSVVASLAKQGEPVRIQEIMEVFEEKRDIRILSGIFHLGRQGELATAKQLLPFISDNAIKIRALNSLASSYIEVGEKEEARALLNEIYSTYFTQLES